MMRRVGNRIRMFIRRSRTARRLRRRLLVWQGKDPRVRVEVRRPVERLGSEYGGWEICPIALSEQPIVYSIGVGFDISFDLAMIDRFHARVLAFDPTPDVQVWIENQDLPPAFMYRPWAVSSFDGWGRFVRRTNPNSRVLSDSYHLVPSDDKSARGTRVKVRSLTSLYEELDHDSVDVLKLDVEGAEYDILDLLLAGTVRPTQIVAEFHHRFPGIGLDKTYEILNKLRDAGYRVFSISDQGPELSLILCSQ